MKYNEKKLQELANQVIKYLYKNFYSGVFVYHNHKRDIILPEYYNADTDTFVSVFDTYEDIQNEEQGAASKHILSIAFRSPVYLKDVQGFKKLISEYDLTFQTNGNCITLIPDENSDIEDYAYENKEMSDNSRLVINSDTVNVFPEIRNIAIAWYQIASLTGKQNTVSKGILFRYKDKDYLLAVTDNHAWIKTRFYAISALTRLGATDICFE